MVKPILLYGGEVWGVDYIETIERVQIQFCKDFLSVRQSTDDCMVLGECGRLPEINQILVKNYYICQTTDYPRIATKC